MKCTIVWHVHDLNISHKGPAVFNEVISSLSAESGKVVEMRVRKGKKHDYL